MVATSAPFSRRRRGRALMLSAVVGLGLVVGPATASNPTGTSPIENGASGTENVLSLGDMWSPWNPAPGEMGTWGVAFAADQVLTKDYCSSLPSKLQRMPCVGRTTKRVLSTWSRNYDDPTAKAAQGSAVSEDNGLAFESDPVDKTFGDGMSLTTTIRLRDGRVFTINSNPTLDSANTWNFKTSMSSDVGRTWTTSNSTLPQAPQGYAWIRLQRGLLELTDGTLLLGGYGAVAGVTGGFAFIIESRDKGKTWAFRTRLAGPRGIDEMDMARTSDGRLVALFRQNGSSGTVAPWPLLQSFSDDDGRTWTPLTEMQAPPGMTNVGIDPNITLLPNGVLMASYGRPDNHVVVSWDGTGQKWDAGDVVYANPVRDNDPGRYHGSSGNTSLQAVGSNYALYVGDVCHTIYFCRELGQQTRVFVRRVDATRPGTGKLDLMTRYLAGSVKVSGTVAAANPLAPESRLAGAIDESTGPTSAAFLKPGTSFTLTLDKIRNINKLGLMLGRGRAQSVDIQTSVDGKAWGQPLIKIRDSVDYAMRYHTFDPVKAKYIRITPTDKRATDITELEVYDADTWTFENDAPNSPPRGLTNTRYAWVADYLFPGLDSRKRLILVDMDPNSTATATVPAPEVPQQHATFGYSGEGYGAGVNFDVNGKNAEGNDVTAWRFLISPDWATNSFKVQVWDGAAWQPLGLVPNMPPNEVMMPVSIDATADTAWLTINGAELKTSVRAAAAVSYHGLTFASNGDAAVNMEHSFDEITISKLAPYSVLTPAPKSLSLLPGIPATTTVPVRNNTTAAVTVPVSVEAAAGYQATAPKSLTIPANGIASVQLSVTRTADAKPASLGVTVGDQSANIALEPTSDWVRGATMAASSTIGGYSVDALKSGRSDPAVWGQGLGWNDATSKVFPDWVTATWQQPVTVAKSTIVTLDTATYSAAGYGARDFDVQVLGDNGDWKTVAEVRGNATGTVTSQFPPVTTTALRVLIHDSGDHTYSRLIAVQAFSS